MAFDEPGVQALNSSLRVMVRREEGGRGVVIFSSHRRTINERARSPRNARTPTRYNVPPYGRKCCEDHMAFTSMTNRALQFRTTWYRRAEQSLKERGKHTHNHCTGV